MSYGYESIQIIYIWLLNISSVFCITAIYNRVFTSRHSRRRRYLYHLAVMTVMALLLWSDRSILPPHAVAVSSLFILPFYTGQIWKKLFYGASIFAVSLSYMYTMDSITYLMNQMFQTFQPYRHFFLTFLILRVLYDALLLLVYLASGSGDTEAKGSAAAFFLLVPVISIVAEFFITVISLKLERPADFALNLPLRLAFILLNLAAVWLYNRLARSIAAEQEYLLLDQQLALQNQHYQELADAHQQIRSLHHDIRNYVRAAASLPDHTGQKELAELVDKAADADLYITTGNQYLDAVLNMKLKEIRSDQIAVSTDIHIPAGLPLSFEQSVAIFGNLLDNAREACLKLEPDSRWLELQLSYLNEIVCVRIANASLPSSLPDHQLPGTTKQDAHLHGIGLKNVRSYVEQSGIMNLTATDSSFRVELLLYLSADS